jgi:dipeptidyl-peptidase III
MSAEASPKRIPSFVHGSEVENFQKHKYPVYYLWVVLHELFGHGTGKMMVQEEEDKYNFDHEHPPIDPLSKEPTTSWYKPGQTWTGQFGDIATTLDECRAELVGAYLVDDLDLLALFGFTDQTEITAKNGEIALLSSLQFRSYSRRAVIYNAYMQLGTDGLQALANFDVEWGG